MNDPYSPPNPPEQIPQPPTPPGLSSDERMWGMLGHLSALSGLMTGGIGNFVGPLIVWQVKKGTMPFAAQQAVEALNFNISWFIWSIALVGMVVVLALVGIGLLLIPLLWVVPIVWAVFVVIGGLKANEGVPYRYPLTIRFVQ